MARRAHLAVLMLLVAAGCRGTVPDCACPTGVEGHATFEGEGCLCLPSLPATPDPSPVTTFHVDPDVAAGGDGSAERPWTRVDMAAVDAALVTGPVRVLFSALEADGASAQAHPERVDVLRTDTGPHRLVLDGRSSFNADDAAPRWEPGTGARARVPGISTRFEDVPRHRVTVRGFEVTKSKDKGIYWRAGDEVLIEDCVVHDNKGSPSVSLDYANRTGLPSSSFTVRNTHVFDQVGECIYIGGSEGEDKDAHARVVIENNLIHDCRHPFGSKNDGINIKDRIGEAVVRRNVVLRADWGVEAGSPGTYSHNLVVDTEREAFQVNLGFGPSRDMLFLDNVAVRAGHDGWHLDTTGATATGLRLERFTSVGAKEAGVLVAVGERLELAIDDVVLVDNGVGLDGWGETGNLELQVGACAAAGNGVESNGLLADRVTCGEVSLSTPIDLAGPDGLVFTEDDGWIVPGRGAQLPP